MPHPARLEIKKQYLRSSRSEALKLKRAHIERESACKKHYLTNTNKYKIIMRHEYTRREDILPLAKALD